MKHPQAKRPNTHKRSDPIPREILFLAARYFALLLIGASNLYIIYAVLTPLTIYVTAAILSIYATPTLIGNSIDLTGVVVEIVPACVAGAAFYLLLILTLSVPEVKPVTRTKAILTAIAILFALNIIRILVLIPLIKTAYFQTIHWVAWHLTSTLFVVATWFAVITLYKIKTIPIYSDIKYIAKAIKNPKRKK